MSAFHRSILVGSVLSGALLLACAGPAHAAGSTTGATPQDAVHHDRLPSLRGLLPRPEDFSNGQAHPARPIPFLVQKGNLGDGALQTSAIVSALPAAGAGFEGIGEGFSGPQGAFTIQYAPPDTVGAVGATQYVQVVNDALAVFDKSTKAVVYGPVPTNTLWQGFGGGCENNNDGDPVVVYDQIAGRWVVSQFSVSTTPYLQCVAVSATSDATGAWYRYSFSYGSVFPDYPKMGVWPDAYYETFNMFGNTFQGAKLCAYDRSAMLNGQPATQQCFQLSSSYGGVLPSDLDGSTLPPSGSPNYMMNFTSNALNLWRFHVDWSNPGNTTLTGPINIPVAGFSAGCSGGGTCIPQSGTRNKLDSLADRLMFRLAYRNFGDHESLVLNHTVLAGSGKGNPTKNNYTGIRWYEIRNPAGTPVVYQQSTYAPDSTYRWMGSIAMDKLGDMALGYSASSSSIHPAIRYTGREVGDPLDTMQAEQTILAGTGSQTGNLSRWGDYSAMTVDPVDDCTFWYTTEYLVNDGSFNWHTRIASFKFPTCQ
ncbi:T9SS type A sorting domain-containing protein [Oleiagrimonas citrea]|uniref:Uncharacterized protein n=1 Tax=Oleiagrimonas citrea TaxID=1665687 RepID=A0A846ZL27_9GAMM|nr:hypothetical protein [Oleiagrimonas citrea]NKZ38397.1 hypothetical protein [Oleiagrimonas citrea]